MKILRVSADFRFLCLPRRYFFTLKTRVFIANEKSESRAYEIAQDQYKNRKVLYCQGLK